MAPREEQDVDSLASLEERISRAVELVAGLRRENQELSEQLKSSEAAREEAVVRADQLGQELEDLRAERKQVRSRIEKLLSQIDLLSTT